MSVLSSTAIQTPKAVIDAHGDTHPSHSQASSTLTRHVPGVPGFWRRSPRGSIRRTGPDAERGRTASNNTSCQAPYAASLRPATLQATLASCKWPDVVR